MIRELSLSVLSIIRPFMNKMLEGVYPSHVECPFCGEERALLPNGLCSQCSASLRFVTEVPPIKPLSGVVAAYRYTDAARDAILKFKYAKATYLANVFAESISIPADWHIDCIVPVPLHRTRQRNRGYNQSELLAQALSELNGDMPVRCDYLKRRRRTKTQQGLTASGRKRNLKDAFQASASVSGKNVLLIDDVVTTGTTLSCCAEELLKQGAVTVYAATVCASILEHTGESK